MLFQNSTDIKSRMEVLIMRIQVILMIIVFCLFSLLFLFGGGVVRGEFLAVGKQNFCLQPKLSTKYKYSGYNFFPVLVKHFLLS